jgi:hypothetical protein
MSMPRALVIAVVATSLVLPAPARADQPERPDQVAAVPDSLEAAWTAGVGGDAPHAAMAYLFEVTFMKIDVAVVEVRVPAHTAAQLSALAAEGKRTDDRRDRAADLLDQADTIAYRLTFKRDSDLGRFFKGMLGNMERAVEGGEITAAEYARVDREYRALMQPHADRGARKGDRLLYRLDGDGGRLIYVGVEGEVMLDEPLDEVWSRAVRASFTGRKSKMRDDLGKLAWES